MINNKYAVIVVTYNRKELLYENICSLLNQTFREFDLYIIDNNSTDGTEKMVAKVEDKRLKYYNTGKNLGGAGGFSLGLRIVAENKYDYAWVMDDDSIPEPNAFESLINKAKLLKGEFSFISSLVYWTDNKFFPMNFPRVEYEHLSELSHEVIHEYKLFPVASGSFVGCFINLEITRKIGLPISEFFIYGDDIEYTYRLRKEKRGYLDIDSSVLHKAPSKVGANIVNADKSRLNRFYYQSRNRVYNARKYNKRRQRAIDIIRQTYKIIRKSPDSKMKRIWILIKGSIAGLFFNPILQYPNIEMDNKVK